MKNDKEILDFPKLVKKAGEIKINKKLDSVSDTNFFKKKMEKGEKMLAIAGLPS